MWWADTTNGVLKIRNSSNNDWVELLQLDGTLTLEDGSASAPALANRGDLDTGVFFSAANTFNVATGGVERMELGATTIFNESGADVDFRIEGDTDANNFYLDAGNNAIGIGTSTPLTPDGSNADNPNNGKLFTIYGGSPAINLIHNTSGSSAASSDYAAINFGRTGGTTNPYRGIIGYKQSSDEFRIATKNIIAFDCGTIGTDEKARFDSSGRLLLGTTTEGQGNADDLTVAGSANSGITIRSGTSSFGQIFFSDGTSGDDEFRGIVGYSHTDNFMKFHTNAIERMRIDSSGRLLLGTTTKGHSTADEFTIANSSHAGITIRSGNTAQGNIYFSDGATGDDSSADEYRGIVRYDHSGNNMNFFTNAEERMRINSSGQVLIGTTSGTGLATSRRLQIRGTNHANVGMNILITANDSNPASIDLGKSRSSGNAILGNNDDVGQINFYGNDGSGFHSMARILCSCNGNDTSDNDLPSKLRFFTMDQNTTTMKECMKLLEDGSFIQHGGVFYVTSPSDSSTAIPFALYTGGSSIDSFGSVKCRIHGDGDIENVNGNYGSISDIKLKENIVDANSQWDDIKAIKIRNYNFKAETTYSTHTQIGVIAQELELVCPKLVTESTDIDNEGNDLGTVTKSVNLSVLYMKAVKCLQEAMTKIEVLETKVAALEAA